MLSTRLKLKNWRNFRDVDVVLGPRGYIIGANAAGKSNLLDVFRFLRTIAQTDGGGLQKAIKERGGLSKLRSLHARQGPVRVEIELSEVIGANFQQCRTRQRHDGAPSQRAGAPGDGARPRSGRSSTAQDAAARHRADGPVRVTRIRVAGEDALCCALGERLVATVLPDWQLSGEPINTGGVTKAAAKHVPDQPENDPDATRTVLRLARLSKVRELRQEMVSSTDINKAGSGYNLHLCRLVTGPWQATRAAARSESLRRALQRLGSLAR